MALIAHIIDGATCASVQMPGHLLLPNPALPNWQGVRPHPNFVHDGRLTRAFLRLYQQKVKFQSASSQACPNRTAEPNVKLPLWPVIYWLQSCAMKDGCLAETRGTVEHEPFNSERLVY